MGSLACIRTGFAYAAWMGRSVMLCLVLWIPDMQAQESAQPRGIQASAVRASRDGAAFFEVRAEGVARATPQQAWQVLTDYEQLHRFVPDLVSSRVLARGRNEATIEQQSRTGFLFLALTVRMVVHIAERPHYALDVERLSGDMRHYAAHWMLEPVALADGAGTRIVFHGELEPDFPLPPLLGDAIVQVNVRRMVEAVIAEIERRNLH